LRLSTPPTMIGGRLPAYLQEGVSDGGAAEREHVPAVEDQDRRRGQGRRRVLYLRPRQAQHDRRRSRLLDGPRAGRRGRADPGRSDARAERNRRPAPQPPERAVDLRSEERRVGKEGRSRWW